MWRGESCEERVCRWRVSVKEGGLASWVREELELRYVPGAPLHPFPEEDLGWP